MAVCLKTWPPPMNNKYHTKSRRQTPWDDFDDRSATENFIRDQVNILYEQRHASLKGSSEIDLLNSIEVTNCHLCGSGSIRRAGHTSNGIQRYYCNHCHHSYTVTTGTLLENHKIQIAELIDYWRNLFRFESLSSDSWNNKNAATTAKYWFLKTGILLKDCQKNIVLSGRIYYDETYLPVRSEDIIRKENGQRLRGHSINQICIAVATTGVETYVTYIGRGQPKAETIYDALKDHIKPGSQLVTDKDPGHRMLVRKLGLKNEEHDSKKIKRLPDNENPLNTVNQMHNLLQKFLRAHSGFKRDDLNDYLNIFAFIVNPPEDQLEKIKKLLELEINTRETLKYRDVFAKK